MSVSSFRHLKVWQTRKHIALEVYRMTTSFPQREIYGLTSQMRRAAVSIPSNIAEGFNRQHTLEYRQFLYVALGSCAELETQAEIACTLGYLTQAQAKLLLERLDHESRMLMSLAKKIQGTEG
jgi:four helix bundle protein